MSQKHASLISGLDLKGLRSHLEGEAFVANDAGYEQASLTWETPFRQQPVMVVLPATTADVIAARLVLTSTSRTTCRRIASYHRRCHCGGSVCPQTRFKSENSAEQRLQYLQQTTGG